MRLDYSLSDTTSGRTHSDIAFWGNIAVAGSYDGFRVFNTDTHQLLVSYLCRGPQNDVSLYPAANGHLLLFLSNDTPQTDGATICSPNRLSDTTACGPACFEGIRIFDLADPSQPQLIRAVYTTAARTRTRSSRTSRTTECSSTSRRIRRARARTARARTRRSRSSEFPSMPRRRRA